MAEAIPTGGVCPTSSPQDFDFGVELYNTRLYARATHYLLADLIQFPNLPEDALSIACCLEMLADRVTDRLDEFADQLDKKTIAERRSQAGGE